MLGALLAIVGGNTAILFGSSVAAKAIALSGYRVVSTVFAVVGLGCLAVLTVTTSTSGLPSGVPERGSVYSILAWQAFTGVVLLARPKRAD